MHAGRYVVISVAGLAVLTCLAVCLWGGLFARGWYGGVLEPRGSLQAGDLVAIEKAIGLKLPAVDAIHDMALIQGKDSFLFLKVSVSSEYAAGLMTTVRSRSRVIRPSRVFGGAKVVPWFAVAEDKIAAAFDDNVTGHVVFCVPDSGACVIYIRTCSTSKRMSQGVYDIFTRED